MRDRLDDRRCTLDHEIEGRGRGPTRMIRDRMRLSPVGPAFLPGTEGVATLDHDDLHPLQAEAIRKMSPERRWEQVVAAIEMARRIREGALSAAHPDWPERRIRAEAARQILRAQS